MLCIPSMFSLTAKETFCSPIALRRAEKWIIQSTRCVTTVFCKPLKSRISAKIYGPESTIFWDGLMMSERITFSWPYFALSNWAQAVPSCPNPPRLNRIRSISFKLRSRSISFPIWHLFNWSLVYNFSISDDARSSILNTRENCRTSLLLFDAQRGKMREDTFDIFFSPRRLTVAEQWVEHPMLYF